MSLWNDKNNIEMDYSANFIRDIAFTASDYYRQLEMLFCQEVGTSGEALGMTLTGAKSLLKKIDIMRASELRNLLIQDLHANHEVVSKILDRTELKDLARDMIGIYAVQECRSSLFRFGVITPTIITFSIILLLTFGKQYKKFKPHLKWISSFFVDENKFWKKVKLARMCSKQFSTYFGLLTMFLSLALEMVIVWINVSVVMSWILPRHSELRQWLFFGVSLPVDTSMVKGMITGNKSKPSEPKEGSWSIDLGSFMTLMSFRWICSRLDDFAAHRMMVYRSSIASPRPQQNHSSDSNLF